MNEDNNNEINFDSLENLETNEYAPPGHPSAKINFRRGAIISGVCLAIGKNFNIDPFLIRTAFIFSLFLGIWGIVAYLVAAVILTKSEYFLNASENSQIQRSPFKLTVIILSALFLLLIFYVSDFLQLIFQQNIFGFSNDLTLSIFLITSGIIIFIKRKELYSNVKISNSTSLYRSVQDKKVSGVCGGIAAYFNQDSSFIRLLWILFSFITAGLGVMIYLVFLTILPAEDLMDKFDGE